MSPAVLSQIMHLYGNFWRQVLLEAPIGTGLETVMAITGMGANDFMDFLLSYFVDLGLIILFRVNIDPALGDIVEAIRNMWEKKWNWKDIFRVSDFSIFIYHVSTFCSPPLIQIQESEGFYPKRFASCVGNAFGRKARSGRQSHQSYKVRDVNFFSI